jgi:hypothetical protein
VAGSSVERRRRVVEGDGGREQGVKAAARLRHRYLNEGAVQVSAIASRDREGSVDSGSQINEKQVAVPHSL